MRLATPNDDPFAAFPGYTITVYTLNRHAAGTSANVTFTLAGQNGTLNTTISGLPQERFAEGGLNEITLFGDIGTPAELTVNHDGSGSDQPDWLPDVVQVRRAGDVSVYCAGFGQWIQKGSPLGVRHRILGRTRYLLKVPTLDVQDAGTDADIEFTIRGTIGGTIQEVKRRVTAASKHEHDPFERGGLDAVYLSGNDVGTITALSVFLDPYGHGDGPQWQPGKIEVYKDSDAPVSFDFTGKKIDPGITVTVP